MTPEMLDSPESYMLVVVCNESVFVEKMAAEIHLDDSNLRTLSLEAPEGSELLAAGIGSIDVDDDSHLIVNIPLPAEGPSSSRHASISCISRERWTESISTPSPS